MRISRSKDYAIHRAIRAFVLLAGILGVAPARAAGSGTWAPFGSFLAAADLDGDRSPDMATGGAIRRDGAGYVLDISFRLSSVEAGVVTVRTPRMAGRLFARDIDGDRDSDIVLESFDHEPLAVLLNDGGGHFHQANLEDYRARLRRSDYSVEDAARQSDSADSGESPASPVAEPAPAATEPDLAGAPALSLPAERFIAAGHSIRATRGPPALL